jgi:hypothetical protein
MQQHQYLANVLLINIDRIIIPTQTLPLLANGAINNGFGQPNHQVNIFKTPATSSANYFYGTAKLYQ